MRYYLKRITEESLSDKSLKYEESEDYFQHLKVKQGLDGLDLLDYLQVKDELPSLYLVEYSHLLMYNLQ